MGHGRRVLGVVATGGSELLAAGRVVGGLGEVALKDLPRRGGGEAWVAQAAEASLRSVEVG